MGKLGVFLASITTHYLCSHVSSKAAKNKKQFTKYMFAVNRLYIEMFQRHGKNLEPDMQMQIQVLQFLRAC